MNQRFLDQTYYEILEVEPAALENEIHQAYLKAKETYSPDSPALYTMFSPEEAKELYKLIQEAYSVLSNHAARREYDSRLIGKPEETTTKAPAASNTPTSSSNAPHSETQQAPLADSVPDGFARTKHSVYEVNTDFETEINNTESYTGEILCKCRTYKEISIEEISDEIRVSKSYLRAIEANDYSVLPADVFIRGFVLQYAKALGLDANKVASSYMKTMRDARV